MSNHEAEQIARETPDALLTCILDMGEILLTSGAEIIRVEDTLNRLCSAYGFTQINVFSITSSIVLTAHCPDDRIITQTRRIPTRNTNLEKVAQVNALSRKICQTPMSVPEFREAVAAIRAVGTYPGWILCLCYVVISATFCVFFGGSAWDAFSASLSGLVLYFIQHFLQKVKMIGVLYNLLASATTALVIVFLVKLGIGDSPEFIISGNIMLLIPGVAFTTALRDLTNGDTLSGLLGLSEAVVKAIALAIGFAAVLVGIGGAL